MDRMELRAPSRVWREALLREAEIWSDDARFVAARDSLPPVERFYELRRVVRPDVKDRKRLVPSELLSAVDAWWEAFLRLDAAHRQDSAAKLITRHAWRDVQPCARRVREFVAAWDGELPSE